MSAEWNRSAPKADWRQVGEEIADVLIYLVRLADVLGLDLAAIAAGKLARAGERFPVDDVRGEAPIKG